MAQSKIPLGENLVYWGFNLLTFGTLWLMKIVIKKAIIESS